MVLRLVTAICFFTQVFVGLGCISDQAAFAPWGSSSGIGMFIGIGGMLCFGNGLGHGHGDWHWLGQRHVLGYGHWHGPWHVECFPQGPVSRYGYGLWALVLLSLELWALQL